MNKTAKDNIIMSWCDYLIEKNTPQERDLLKIIHF